MDIVEEPPAHCQVAQRRQRPFVLTQRQKVRRHLLQDELVERQIFIERANDIIAIGVRIRVPPFFLEHVALGIGVAGHIQPMPAPALAVLWRSQQPVHDLGEGVG